MPIDPTQIHIDTRADRPTARRPTSQWRGPFAFFAAAAAILACLFLAVVGVVGLVAPVPDEGFWAANMENLEEQYRIVVRANSPQLDRGIRAAAVAEGYLHANDEEAYRRWKAISERHLRAAGLPSMP